ncbi:hypothetical protein [Sphingomonas sp. Leaf257]|jgi:hypothetical protein|uniref:hypothetical protein n=1 Tax=Sphingomonas sp. Leaf257 TaxID=1736309 RepID=UPI0012E1BDA6|nr:hypothetical protein [Sphingomonas sp. Leaf257]
MAMNRRSTGAAAKSSSRGVAWTIGIIGTLVVLVNVSKCSLTSPRTPAEVAASDPAIKTLTSSVAAQTPPAVQPLSSPAVREGIAEMGKAFASEGLSGSMIYSQNCYDALSNAFSWRLLDTCGAADLKGVASVPEDEVNGMEKEIAYFQSEVAAARYLAATTGAGASADDADTRLAEIQRRVPPAKRAPADGPDIDNTSAVPDGAVTNGGEGGDAKAP